MMISKPEMREGRAAFFSILMLLFGLGDISAAAGTRLGFTFSIHEKRNERVVTPGADAAVPADFETDITLFGRIAAPGGQAAGGTATFNDSIRFSTTLPFPFESFMSRDTFYFNAEGKPAVVSTGAGEHYDSMLACVFEGPALEIAVRPDSPDSLAPQENSSAPRPPAIRNLKPDCGSGGYSRIDLPVSLGFFFMGTPANSPVKDYTWREVKTLPSFSGMGFHPDIAVPMRIVALDSDRITAVFSADTVVEDVSKTMPNGETIDILEYRIHIGGTLVVDRSDGVPRGGEVRIEEEISYLRRRVSSLVASKSCSSLLRLKTY